MEKDIGEKFYPMFLSVQGNNTPLNESLLVCSQFLLKVMGVIVDDRLFGS